MEDHDQDPLDQLTTRVYRFLTSWLIELSTGEIKVIKEGIKNSTNRPKKFEGIARLFEINADQIKHSFRQRELLSL